MAKVLIIDDEERVRRAMRFALEMEGFEIGEAADGDAGLARLAAERFDLVICDLLMPGREGVSTIDEICNGTPRLPVIAVSGGGQTGRMNFLEFAREIGADAIMEKPVSSEALVERVNALLGNGAPVKA